MSVGLLIMFASLMLILPFISATAWNYTQTPWQPLNWSARGLRASVLAGVSVALLLGAMIATLATGNTRQALGIPVAYVIFFVFMTWVYSRKYSSAPS